MRKRLRPSGSGIAPFAADRDGGGGVRVVRNWPDRKYGLNEALVDPPVKYGDMGEFSHPLSPGAFEGGVLNCLQGEFSHLQGCFLRWPVSPAWRRFRDVQRPVSGRLGVFLFPAFGLGPHPRRDNCCVKEILRISRLHVPT